MSQTILPTKVYRTALEYELERRRSDWPEHWGDYDDVERREEIGRNILASMKVYEYPTRGLRDDLRQYIALRIAPWLLP